jgi:hypothetical protein
MTNGIYRYSEYFGRMGSLDGVFVATDKEVAEAMGKTVHMGEVLGKHSDINAHITPETITRITEDPQFVKFFFDHIGEVGHNPIEQYDPDEEDENG